MRIKNIKLNLKNIVIWFKNSIFIKNMLIVMSGTALAQIIGFALTPIISRLFTPADFGIFGSFNAVSGVIAAGVTLEYSQAIMLPKEKRDAFDVLFISCIATLIISLLCALICLVTPTYMMEIMNAPGRWVLALLVFTVLITGFNITMQSWCVRVKAFKQTSASQVIRSVSSNAMQIGLGLFKTGSVGLVISSVLADLFASINLLCVFWVDFKTSAHQINWYRIKQLARDYIDFPIYTASGNVINALSMGLPVLLLANYFGIIVAGAFAFAERILSAPMGLVLRALRQVLFQKAAETDHHGGSLLALYIKVTAGLFALSVIPSVILFIWAPQIFALIFGHKWLIAGEFASYLVIWLTFMFCNLPSLLFARILRLQRQLFIFGIILLSVRTMALVIGGMHMTASFTVFLFSVVGAIMNVIYIVIVGLVLMKKEGKDTWKDLAHLMKEG
ncbi:oligosaccharide flippase family protein [Syntrophus buswellii]|uniref:oligosaccharide flippase family protein n=1 Tax=Syntrophus buswellii TaxID=43774 RepID=UPI0038D4254B